MNGIAFAYSMIFSAIIIIPFVIWANDKRSAEEFNDKYPCSTIFRFSIKIKEESK